MEAGFTITKQGWKLLAKLLAGDKLEISKIMVGSGKVPEGVNPGEITELVRPVALATSTVPQVEDKQVSFIVEYRSDLNGGLAEGFWLNEFGVYANDPDNGEILLYYATMGDYPQYVAAYNGQAVDVRRYPVVIALSECYNVELKPPAGAWVTFEELAETLKRRGYHSNLNLLINGDFRKPVNRNGKSRYEGLGYMIDNWCSGSTHTILQIDNNSLILKPSQGIAYFSQSIANGSLYVGKTLTGSVLLSDNSLISCTQVVPIIPTNEEYTLFVNTGSQHNLVRVELYTFRTGELGYQFRISGEFQPIAAKLELGSVQTLAHKDENGNWVLNDPPNYDLQYALCNQYSPITGEFVGSQHSNPNLLDNAYWADKGYIINQRGLDEYTGVGYTIDRVKIINGKVKVMDNYLEVTLNAQYSSLSFPLDCFDIRKTYTLSWLLELVTSGIVYTEIYANGLVGYNNISTQGINILTGGGVVNTKITAANLVNAGNTPVTLKVYAAKLELGSVQTLAHKDENGNWVLNDPPPNNVLELAKCQRYQRVLSRGTIAQVVNSNSVVIKYPFDQPMRVAPVSVILNPQMKFLSAVEVLPPATNASILSSDMTDKGVAYMHITGFNWSLPANTVVALNDDNAVLLDANI